MIQKKIAKIIRGKATPFQLASACVLGAGLGFVPGLTQAPGLILLWVVLLAVLNANLGVAAFAMLGAKAISIPLSPVSFEIGRVLLDGPTEPLFKWAINAPVLAWFGFEYYAVTGGQLVGIVLGLVAGIALVGFVKSFRKKMASIEESSELYKKLNSKKSVRLVTWLLIGKKPGKKSYNELLDHKGSPIRVLGVVAAALLIGLVFLAAQFATEPIVTAGVKSGLERANGATVDLASADLDLQEGKLRLTGLAIADPNALETDLLRAGALEADVGGLDLLRKRIALDRLEITDASNGLQRAIPGKIIGKAPAPEPAPPPSEEGAKTINDYMKDAEVWRERLGQARRWLEELSKQDGKGEDESTAERIKRERRELGISRVRASHLIDGSPRFLVRELVINGMTTARLPGEILDVSATSLSTHPGLVDEAPTGSVVSRSGKLTARFSLGGIAATPSSSSLSLSMLELDVEETFAMLTSTGAASFTGGTLDVSIDGSLDPTGRPSIDAPLIATLRNTTVSIGGGNPTQIDTLDIPIHLSGPIDSPYITLSDDALKTALVEAGKAELANRLEGEAGKLLDDAVGDAVGDVELPGEVDEVTDKVGDAIGNVFGGKKDKDEDK